MKKQFIFTMLILSILAAFAFKGLERKRTDKDWLACLEKYDSKWGEKCKNCVYYKETHKRSYDDTYTVFLRNSCAEKIDVKCCVQEEDKSWRCYSVSAMAANDTLVAYACKGTGKYLKWVRSAGDKEIIFPTDQEVSSTYKD